MIRTILVPVDGSNYSEQALLTAKVVAQSIEAKLELVRATSASVFPGVDPTDAQVKAVSKADTYLADLANQLREEHIPVETASPYLSPSDGILLEIRLRQADMVIMSTHARSGVEGWFLGSVAEEVLSHSPVPVLLIKPTDSVEPLQLGSSKSPLLVPLDGSGYAEVALPHAVALSQALDRDIVLLRVVDANYMAVSTPRMSWQDPREAREPLVPSKIETAADYLTGVVDRLDLKKARVQSVIRPGRPAEAIREESKATNAGMIVMATHGHTGLRSPVMGSVAWEEVRKGSLPVLLVPPDELRKSKEGILDTRQPTYSGI